MDIYFCASIRGGRKFLSSYQKIVKYLQKLGHNVLTEHIVYDDVLGFEKDFTPQEIYERDIRFLNKSKVAIAEVSNPSLGVGYEICYAIEKNIPILCLYQNKYSVSCMITGNTSHKITLFEYKNDKSLFEKIDKFLKKLG